MKLFPVLPVSGTGLASWLLAGAPPARHPLAATFFADARRPAAGCLPPGWTITLTTAATPPMPRLVGPGEQSENQQEEDTDDLELGIDEDPSKLRSARPGNEDGGTAARGGDGTINPPFP